MSLLKNILGGNGGGRRAGWVRIGLRIKRGVLRGGARGEESGERRVPSAWRKNELKKCRDIAGMGRIDAAPVQSSRCGALWDADQGVGGELLLEMLHCDFQPFG